MLLAVILLSVKVPIAQSVVTDIDGNEYHTVVIGTQVWLQENLKVLHNPDGSVIENAWAYNNVVSNVIDYGRLYDWNSAMNNSTVEKAQGICPDGWHVPSLGEWNVLSEYLGGAAVAGGKLKEAGTGHWDVPNTGATNSSGFTALPAGEWDGNVFQFLHTYAVIWSSTEASDSWAHYKYLSHEDAELHPYTYFKDFGYSVRCVKDTHTGINEIKNKVIRIYPNPTRDFTEIVLNDKTSGTVILKAYSIAGREIRKWHVTAEEPRIDVTTLAPGAYIITVELNERTYRSRLIKL